MREQIRAVEGKVGRLYWLCGVLGGVGIFALALTKVVLTLVGY